ncbi:MAG TPA: hypothetical protein VFR23_19290 [Jiangellaceae bacterium]|nr:hypothetical protein [Jiangellaceae bacterium]
MTTREEREAKVRGWITGRLPDDWFDGPVEVTIDRDEITVVGTLRAPDVPAEKSDAERAAAIAGRVKQFREETRERRIEIARELEYRSDRKVAWGVDCEGERHMFTRLAAPVMTRLRQPERQVLDTLVDAGVARSRSEALAWCVKLVGQHTEEWLAQLREAMAKVEQVRAAGPTSG